MTPEAVEAARKQAFDWWEEYIVTNECDPQEDFDWYVAGAIAAHTEAAVKELKARAVLQKKYRDSLNDEADRLAQENADLTARLAAAEGERDEIVTKFQTQRKLLNQYESAPGFHETVEARAAAYHEEACAYKAERDIFRDGFNSAREEIAALKAERDAFQNENHRLLVQHQADAQRVRALEGALRKIQHHCEVAATHAAIYSVAEKALTPPPAES